MTLQQECDFVTSLYGELVCGEDEEVSIEEMDEAISDCKAMLDYSIDRGNKEEVFYWRKLLQENKVHRRKMLNA